MPAHNLDGDILCVEAKMPATAASLRENVANLQAQLREAQEERDRAFHWCNAVNRWYVGILEIANRYEAERDAAIAGRVVAVEAAELAVAKLVEYQRRAEAAERDAKAKGALAETRRELLQRVINTRGCPYCGWADGRHLSNDCPYLAALTPAEKEAPE